MKPTYYIRFYLYDGDSISHFRYFNNFRTAFKECHAYIKKGVIKIFINQIPIYDLHISDKFIPALLEYNKELDKNFIKDIYGKLHPIAW